MRYTPDIFLEFFDHLGEKEHQRFHAPKFQKCRKQKEKRKINFKSKNEEA